jgi:hypothetical protein
MDLYGQDQGIVRGQLGTGGKGLGPPFEPVIAQDQEACALQVDSFYVKQPKDHAQSAMGLVPWKFLLQQVPGGGCTHETQGAPKGIIRTIQLGNFVWESPSTDSSTGCEQVQDPGAIPRLASALDALSCQTFACLQWMTGSTAHLSKQGMTKRQPTPGGTDLRILLAGKCKHLQGALHMTTHPKQIVAGNFQVPTPCLQAPFGILG